MYCMSEETLRLVKAFTSSSLYNEFPIVDSEDLIGVFVKASRNRLLYAFSNKLLDRVPEGSERARALSSIVLKGRTMITRYKYALRTICNLLTEADLSFLIVKTVKSYPYVPSDLDVLVQPHDFQRVLNVLGSCDYISRSDEDLYGESKATLVFHNSATEGSDHWGRKPWLRWDSEKCLNITKVDLHSSLTWQGASRISSNFAWDSPRMVKMFEMKLPVPNIETEILCGVASMLFDHRCIRLLDFLTLIDNIEKYKIHWNSIFREARRNFWELELRFFLGLVSRLYDCVFEGRKSLFTCNASVQKYIDTVNGQKMSEVIDFPFILPFNLVLRSTLRCGGPIDTRLIGLSAFLFDNFRSTLGIKRADEYHWLSDHDFFELLHE